MGLEQIQVHEPDLIITDIQMPRMDGKAMIENIRRLPACQDLPIVAITAHGTERAAEAVKAGVSSSLCHPIEGDALLPLVGRLLKKNLPRSFEVLLKQGFE